MRASIVGAGVSGLTSASCLLDAGWNVELVARELHEDAVSFVAAAIWTTTSAEPAEQARPWAIAGWERFNQLADDPATGVARLPQREFERVDPGPSPWDETRFRRRLEASELPDEFAVGYEIDGFVIEPPIYLSWLRQRVIDAGANIKVGEVGRLENLDGDLVVNCAGLGAERLVGDGSMFPIRGQVVAVTNPGIRDGTADESDIDRIAYVYPRSKELVLGGVREAGNDQKEPDDDTTRRILADCARLDPRVADLEVQEVRVGLRPGRPRVRVEADSLADGRPLIHNYGHSGAGFILSWGCAGDVVSLAAVHLSG